MSRNVLKSNNSIIMLTESPAFTTGDVDGVLMAGVVNSSFGFEVDRQSLKHLGSKSFVVNDPVRQPDVSFEMSYLFSPSMINENFLGIGSGSESQPVLSGLVDKSYNFCYLHHPTEGYDAINQYLSNSPDFSGFEAVAIGNAYLTNYSVNYSIGQIPVVSTRFAASNIKYEVLTGNSIQSPAINLDSGNNINVGDILFTGFPDNPDRSRPLVLKPSDLELSLQNIQVGGQTLSGNHFVQTFELSLDLPRVPLYGLGSDYVFDRKLLFPVNTSINISSLVSGFETGEISGLLQNEQTYDFEIFFTDISGLYSGKFIINDAVLNTSSYSMAVNGNMSCDFGFSCPSSSDGGIFLSGSTSELGSFNTITEIWSQISQIWSEA